MQISHRYKFIFFSFPKTGSESVRELLDPFSDIHGIPYWERSNEQPFYSHISPREVKQLFEKNNWDYNSYYKFTFVRNPWARIVSLYNMIYHTRPATSLLGKVKQKLKANAIPTFEQWLQSIDTGGRGAGGPDNQRWQVYGAYSIKNYIFDEDETLLVDEVIKLEEINQRLPALLKHIGIPDAENLSIPFVNRRSLKKYADYYTTSTDKLIQEKYDYDIQQYQYTFDELK